MLNYHALTQGESESGAEFADRELREQQLQRSMQSFVGIAREKTINCQIAQRKSQFPIRRGLKTPIRLPLLSPVQPNASGSHALFVLLHILRLYTLHLPVLLPLQMEMASLCLARES